MWQVKENLQWHWLSLQMLVLMSNSIFNFLLLQLDNKKWLLFWFSNSPVSWLLHHSIKLTSKREWRVQLFWVYDNLYLIFRAQNFEQRILCSTKGNKLQNENKDVNCVFSTISNIKLDWFDSTKMTLPLRAHNHVKFFKFCVRYRKFVFQFLFKLWMC